MKVQILIKKLEMANPNSEVFLLIKDERQGKFMEIECYTFSLNYQPITGTALKVVQEQSKTIKG